MTRPTFRLPRLLAAGVFTASALAAGLLAAAQPAPPVSDPQIAYAKPSGKSAHLYVANADGGRPVGIATVDGNIDAVDWSPLGTQIAFSDREGVKIVDLQLSASDVVASAPRLVARGGHAPDFSGDGSRLLYRDESLNAVRLVAAAGGTPRTIYPESCNSPRWLRTATLGNAFACHRIVGGNPVVYQVWVVLLDAADNVESAGPVVSSHNQPFKVIDEEFDVARGRDALLVVTDFPAYPRAVEVDIATGATTMRGPAREAHFSRTDGSIVHLTPHSSSGDYVGALDVATGQFTRLSRKGEYGPIDARP